MMRRFRPSSFILGAIAILVAALFASGCGSSDSSTTTASNHIKPGGSLTVATGEVETLDPTKALGGPSILAVTQIMETLYRFNPKDEIEPWLVSSVKKLNSDQKWIFQLRNGVKFSNGKPMTAEDAVFSIDMARKSANYATLFEPFKTVKALSPTTLEITTSHPLPSMEAILTTWVSVVVPKNFGGISEKEFGEHPIGTGPFKFVAWHRGSSVNFERNPDYWKKGYPHVDDLTFKIAPEDNSRLAQLRAGDLDLIEAPPLAQLESLEQSPSLAVSASPPALAQYIVVNAREKKLQDPRLREAINLAVDREAINKTAMAGHGELGASFLVPALPYHDSELQPPARNIAKAKKLVAEAVAAGAEPSFTLAFPVETRYSFSSQIIKSDLEEVGFKVSLEPLEGSALLEELSGGNFEVALEALSAGIPDPSENVALYLSTESFFTGAENKTVTKLAEDGATETDTSKRRHIYYEIQEEVAKENFLITLGYEPYFWAHSQDLLGTELNGIGGIYLFEAGFSK